jgi:hypothetical protein
MYIIASMQRSPSTFRSHLTELCPGFASILRYFSRLLPMMLINGHCVLLEKKCAQICNTPKPRCAGSWKSVGPADGSVKSVTA